MLSVRKNQPQLHQDITDTFGYAREGGSDDTACYFHQTVGKRHGRAETRKRCAISEPDCLRYVNVGGAWKKMARIAAVDSERSVNGETCVESRLCISGLPGDARSLPKTVRGRRGVKDPIHRVLDTSAIYYPHLPGVSRVYTNRPLI